jgi:hypothetical protein
MEGSEGSNEKNAPVVDQAGASSTTGNTAAIAAGSTEMSAPAGDAGAPYEAPALTPLTVEQRLLRVEQTQAELTAAVDEIGAMLGNYTRLLDRFGGDLDGIGQAVELLGEQLRRPPPEASRLPLARQVVEQSVRPDVGQSPVRTAPRGGHRPVVGGPVLPPLRPAPSVPHGALPKIQPAPSVGPRPNVSVRHIPEGHEIALDVSQLPEGTHIIPGSEETGGVPIQVNVKRPVAGGGMQRRRGYGGMTRR